MSENSIFKTSWNDASEAEATYTRLCVLALLAALFGAGTFFVYFSPWFFFIGVIAILLSLVALWTIHNGEGTLTGAPLAYFGLCCGVAALVSIAVFWSAYQYGVRREADQFFRLWFATVQQGDIPRAKEFRAVYASRSRAASADEWWEAQYGDKFAHRSIHDYVGDRLLRVLVALGDKATISYYETLSVVSARENETVVSVYAVIFPGASGVPETFFVRISGKRLYPAAQQNFKAAGWHLESTPTFYLPDEFKQKTE